MQLGPRAPAVEADTSFQKSMKIMLRQGKVMRWFEYGEDGLRCHCCLKYTLKGRSRGYGKKLQHWCTVRICWVRTDVKDTAASGRYTDSDTVGYRNTLKKFGNRKRIKKQICIEK